MKILSQQIIGGSIIFFAFTSFAKASAANESSNQIITQDSIQVELKVCQQNKSNVIRNFLLTNKDPQKDRKVVLFNRFNFRGESRANQIVSDGGDQFSADKVIFGDGETGNLAFHGPYYIAKNLIENVPIKASLIFNTTKPLTKLAVVELKLVDDEMGGVKDIHPIRFRNVQVFH